MSGQRGTSCAFVPLSEYDWTFRSGFLPWNPTVYCVVAALGAISMWMTIELTIQVYFTFKRHTGLYFWSTLITTWGVTVREIGRILRFFVYSVNPVASIALTMLGWVMMITGFSVVLYSRLHLVIADRRILRAVLWMIIVDAILLHTPIIVMQIGLATPSNNMWVPIIVPMERIMIAGFTLQETILSSLYIGATWKLVRPSYAAQTRKTMIMLIAAQVVVILIDLPALVLGSISWIVTKATIHSIVYAIKLKIEFIVLNQLLFTVKHGITPEGIADEDGKNSGNSNTDNSLSTNNTITNTTTVSLDNEKKSLLHSPTNFPISSPKPSSQPHQPIFSSPFTFPTSFSFSSTSPSTSSSPPTTTAARTATTTTTTTIRTPQKHHSTCSTSTTATATTTQILKTEEIDINRQRKTSTNFEPRVESTISARGMPITPCCAYLSSLFHCPSRITEAAAAGGYSETVVTRSSVVYEGHGAGGGGGWIRSSGGAAAVHDGRVYDGRAGDYV